MLNEQDTVSGCIIFENKTGIPITSNKECTLMEVNRLMLARVLIREAGMAQR